MIFVPKRCLIVGNQADFLKRVIHMKKTKTKKTIKKVTTIRETVQHGILFNLGQSIAFQISLTANAVNEITGKEYAEIMCSISHLIDHLIEMSDKSRKAKGETK